MRNVSLESFDKQGGFAMWNTLLKLNCLWNVHERRLYCVCLLLCSRADAEAVGSSGWRHERWPPCKRSLVQASYLSRVQVKVLFFQLMMLSLVFQRWRIRESSHGESQESYYQVRFIFYNCVFCKVFVLKTIFILYHRFQTESERWEELLNKHRTKAEELER